VARHESLRTVFPDRLGVPHQLILQADKVQVPMIVTAVSTAELPAALTQAAQHGFDLSRGPPLRAHLFVLGDSEHVLLLSLHHIAGDGWSLAPIARDLSQSYAARLWGVAPALPVLPVAICRLYAVAGRGAGGGRGRPKRDRAPAGVLA